MIRKDTYYKGKRTNDLLKYKLFLDEEFKVIDIESELIRVIIDGIEEEEKMLSAVLIDNNGTIVKVGSGFSFKERCFARDVYPERLKIVKPPRFISFLSLSK